MTIRLIRHHGEERYLVIPDGYPREATRAPCVSKTPMFNHAVVLAELVPSAAFMSTKGHAVRAPLGRILLQPSKTAVKKHGLVNSW